MKRDLLTISDLDKSEIERIFSVASELKGNIEYKPLNGKTLVLVFQHPSLRTRVSFEVGIYQLGGNVIYIGKDEVGFGERETIQDMARTLSCYADGIVVRTSSHNDIVTFAKWAKIPVINGLSNLFHPCQVLSDLYTLKERFGEIKGRSLAFIGDGNNVCHSLLLGCSILGLDIKVATPKLYEPKREVVKKARDLAKVTEGKIEITNDPRYAVKDADVIYTDVWVSMGEEGMRDIKIDAFKGYQVNKELVKLAKDDVLIMHCLPAHRGEEITDEVIDSKKSIVFEQAENRLHLQKAILTFLLG